MNITGKARIILVDGEVTENDLMEKEETYMIRQAAIFALIMPIAVTLRLSCLLVFDFLSLWYRERTQDLCMHTNKQVLYY